MRNRFAALQFCALSICVAAVGWAQEFEVASVKIATSGFNGVRGGCRGIDTKYTAEQIGTTPPLGRCVITDGRLSHLIGIAYGVSMAQIKDAPDWVIANDERYNVDAKVADPTTAKQAELLRMLQNLLVSRFELKFHRETKDRPGLALSLGKGAPKIQESHAERCSIRAPKGKQGPGAGAFELQGCTIGSLVSILPGLIVDETGLSGIYDLKLDFNEMEGPTLVTAVREQLGMRLESKTVPYEYFVIESAKRPSAN